MKEEYPLQHVKLSPNQREVLLWLAKRSKREIESELLYRATLNNNPQLEKDLAAQLERAREAASKWNLLSYEEKLTDYAMSIDDAEANVAVIGKKLYVDSKRQKYADLMQGIEKKYEHGIKWSSDIYYGRKSTCSERGRLSRAVAELEELGFIFRVKGKRKTLRLGLKGKSYMYCHVLLLANE